MTTTISKTNFKGGGGVTIKDAVYDSFIGKLSWTISYIK